MRSITADFFWSEKSRILKNLYIKTVRKNEYISDYFDRLAGNVPVLLGSCPWGEVAERKTWSVRRRMSCSSKPLYLTVIRFPVFYLSYLYIMVE